MPRAQHQRIRQRTQTERQLKSLTEAGLLEGVGLVAMVALVRGLADAIDNEADAGGYPAALWKEYRQAWADLRRESRELMVEGLMGDDAPSSVDPTERMLREIDDELAAGGTAPVRNTKAT